MTQQTTLQGWVEDVPGHMYHAGDELSASALGQFARSPAHFAYRKANPLKQTSAMILGSVVHADIAGLFDEEFLIAPEINKRTNEGKELWAEFTELALKAHKAVITEEVAEKGKDIATALQTNPWVIESIGDGLCEMSGFFTHHPADDSAPVQCRIRPDYLDDTLTVNWKVTANAEPHSFATHAAKMGYLVPSTGFYEMGMIALDGHGREHYLVTVESSLPYIVTPYRIPDAVVDWSLEETRKMLEDYVACRDTDSWLGYDWRMGEDPIDLYPPNWIVSRRMLQEEFDEQGVVV